MIYGLPSKAELSDTLKHKIVTLYSNCTTVMLKIHQKNNSQIIKSML